MTPVIRTAQPRKNSGLALVTELMSLMIFGLGVLALSNLTTKTSNTNSEAVQRIHAVWLANSLRSRMQMNPSAAREMAYEGTKVQCNDIPDTRVQQDLAALFCPTASAQSSWVQNKPIDVMGEVEWSIECHDNNLIDADQCSKNSPLTLEVAWAAPGTVKTMNKVRLKLSAQ